MRTYRVSSLAAAAVRMWSAWRVLVPVVVLNALIQSFMIWPPYVYGQAPWHVVSAIVSAIALWAAFGMVACAAMLVPLGQVTWSAAHAVARPRLLPFALWAICWGILVAVGMAVYTFPAVIIAALLVYLPFAVLDGERRPIRTAIGLVGNRFWRWLITVVIAGVVLLVGWILAGFGAFFLRGPLATATIWLIGGVLISWFTTAFALVFVDARTPFDVVRPTVAGTEGTTGMSSANRPDVDVVPDGIAPA